MKIITNNLELISKIGIKILFVALWIWNNKSFMNFELDLYLKNKKLLQKNHSYSEALEHDACGVGLITSLDG